MFTTEGVTVEEAIARVGEATIQKPPIRTGHEVINTRGADPDGEGRDEAPPAPAQRPAAAMQPPLFPAAARPAERKPDRKAEPSAPGMTLWDALLPHQADLLEASGVPHGVETAPIPAPVIVPLSQHQPSPLPVAYAQATDQATPQMSSEEAPERPEACVVCGGEMEVYSSEGQPYCFAHLTSFQPATPPLAEKGGTAAEESARVAPSLPGEPAAERMTRPALPGKQDEAETALPSPVTPDQQVVAALQYLAGVCDGARRLDGHGFNKLDAGFGHSLAEQSLAKPLSLEQLRKGHTMLLEYQRQLHEVASSCQLASNLLPGWHRKPQAHRSAGATGASALKGNGSWSGWLATRQHGWHGSVRSTEPFGGAALIARHKRGCCPWKLPRWPWRLSPHWMVRLSLSRASLSRNSRGQIICHPWRLCWSRCSVCT